MKTVSEEPNAVVWDCGYWVKHDAPECYANETHNLRRQLAQARARIAELVEIIEAMYSCGTRTGVEELYAEYNKEVMGDE